MTVGRACQWLFAVGQAGGCLRLPRPCRRAVVQGWFFSRSATVPGRSNFQTSKPRERLETVIPKHIAATRDGHTSAMHLAGVENTRWDESHRCMDFRFRPAVSPNGAVSQSLGLRGTSYPGSSSAKISNRNAVAAGFAVYLNTRFKKSRLKRDGPIFFSSAPVKFAGDEKTIIAIVAPHRARRTALPTSQMGRMACRHPQFHPCPSAA